MYNVKPLALSVAADIISMRLARQTGSTIKRVREAPPTVIPPLELVLTTRYHAREEPPLRTIIELPDSVYRKGEQLARTQGVTIEEFIVRTFERELKDEPDTPSHSNRVTLPLVLSNQPGTLDLKDFNFDDLLT